MFVFIGIYSVFMGSVDQGGGCVHIYIYKDANMHICRRAYIYVSRSLSLSVSPSLYICIYTYIMSRRERVGRSRRLDHHRQRIRLIVKMVYPCKLAFASQR